MERLIEDLKSFPAQFMLFVDGVSEIRIRIGDEAPVAFASEKINDHLWRLFDGTKSSEYVVFRQMHRPSDAALAEVSEAVRRPEVTVTYAAPLDDAQARGEFWAYYPLQDVTSARGIHNAPWRINDDRTNLLDGQFNEELLVVLAHLIVMALPYLRTADDPARHFDYLPARGREITYTADKRLSALVPQLASQTACIPDAEGNLKLPDVLSYPEMGLNVELASVRIWDQSPGRPVLSPHWSCFKSNTRKFRLRTLIRPDNDAIPNERELSASEWLEALVRDATDDQCDYALQVYSSIKDEATRALMLEARIIPDANGRLSSLDATSELFLRGNLLSEAAGLRLVRRSFLVRENVEERLRSLGFVDVDPKHELERLANQVARTWDDDEWRAFWSLVDQVSPDDAVEILVAHLNEGLILKVLSRDGSWRPVGTVVVPAVVNPTKGALAVDVSFHERHLGLLRELGVAERPVMTSTALRDLTLLEYLRICRDIYVKGVDSRQRPDLSTINFAESKAWGPLYLLRRFEDEDEMDCLTSWTRELLEADGDEFFTLQQNPGRGAVLAPQRVRAPHLWAAERYGRIESSWGPRQPHQTLSHSLAEFSALLPVARWPVSAKVSTITTIDDVTPELWREFVARHPDGGDPFLLGDLLLRASRSLGQGAAPESLPAVRGVGWDVVPATDLLVARSDDECRALRHEGLPFVALAAEEDAQSLVSTWRCSLASTLLSVEIVTEEASDPVRLLDRFPTLRNYVFDELDNIEIVECSSLQQVVSSPAGTESHYLEVEQSGQKIYYEATFSEEELVGWISEKLGLGLNPLDVQHVLSATEDLRIRERIAACRAQADPADKLLALLPARELEMHLPTGLLASIRQVSGEGEERQVAELLLLVHGFDALAEVRKELAEAGYSVPDRWAGSAPAVAFVRSLGFPTEYAGERNRGLQPEFVVLGPPNLDSLHPYQSDLAEQIRRLLRNRDRPERAMLFLPTGAGKTRVTVEAAAKSLISGESPGPILWIAQSEELCEQAVQTWTTVWRQFGDQPLRICRLWRHHEVARSDNAVTVIVATDAKLDKIRESDDYEWIKSVSAVIIDEAHGATAPGITQTLRWLGIRGRNTTSVPLLGLTATPFAGRGVEKNERLSQRFGGQLLQIPVEDPYAELQRLGVLATVEHQPLRGATVALNPDEVQKVNTFGDLPNSVLERVGKDHERTVTLLRHIEELPDDWPVLVFTSSVLSAQVLSALLRVRGIPSGTVSGSTRTGERRRIIESFREGSIRVLTNCNLLTQGFDAPAVRALYIARPTFSPNAYIQMVGRGLRGELNGGKAECLIVNVEDTFNEFGHDLAYKDFDYLWQKLGKKNP
ncbi:MAG: DEAD/DEAH box helicase family protein [Fimbriimonadaceae bacterium]|nr:DEAD/DEAH box helicase family protein [Fimbriimonadaceae bacterium]